MLKSPFISFNYHAEAVTPIHIGASKENDYAAGQDYFYESGIYYFILKRRLYKTLTNQQVAQYANALANNNTRDAERVLSQAADKDPDLVYHSSECPFEPQPSIKKHIADGMGNLIIPGSSLKGAIRSIIGKYLMQETRQNRFDERELFGTINNNLMRYLQVGDIGFTQKGEVTPFKIFSGDVQGVYKREFEGIGMWKHQRNGGHNTAFNSSGFVTHAETLIEGASSMVRLNWADEIFKAVPDALKHTIARFYDYYKDNNWLEIAQSHTREYLEQEIAFFERFPNDDFDYAIDILKDLVEQNNAPNTALIRLGAGSGFHAITGNWKYRNHVDTEQAIDRGRQPMNAIQYKTRKVGFYNVDNETYKQFPGYLKLTYQP